MVTFLVALMYVIPFIGGISIWHVTKIEESDLDAISFSKSQINILRFSFSMGATVIFVITSGLILTWALG